MEALPQEFDAIAANDLFRVLAEPVRIQIIRRLLAAGPSDIQTIAEGFSQDRSVISRHLKQLHESGIIQARKESRRMVYSFDGELFLERLEDLTARVRHLVRNPCCDD